MRLSDVQTMTAEKSVLGAMFLEPWAVGEGVRRLSPADFVNEANRTVSTAMRGLREAGKPVDFLTVYDAIGDNSTICRIGGLDYLLDLNNFVPSAVNIEHYINTVLENAREHRLGRGMARIIESGDEALPQGYVSLYFKGDIEKFIEAARC